jgi:sugar-specific transcriptional regulator TrmB
MNEFDCEMLSGLELLGFSPNEAKVYITLVKQETCTAKELGLLSGVSREEVYRKLSELEKLGFVHRSFTKPVTFKAVLPEIVFNSLLKRRAEELSNMQLETQRLINYFSNNGKKENLQERKYEILFIPEQRPLFEKAKEELKNVKNSLDTICPWKKGLGWLAGHYDFFIKALNRNVNVRFLFEKAPEDVTPKLLKEFQAHPRFQIKTVEKLPPACMGLYDNKRLIVDTTARSSFVATPCLWTNNPSIVGMAQLYFESAWTTN